MNGYIYINSMDESYGTVRVIIVVKSTECEYTGYTISKFKTKEEFENKVPFTIKYRTPSYSAGGNHFILEFYNNKFMFMYASYLQRLEVKTI